MSHDLEILDGEASFAFNGRNGDPWHSLGVAIDGNMTIPEALKACRGDYIVTKEPIKAQVPTYLHNGALIDGLQVEIEDKIATVRINPVTGQPIPFIGIEGCPFRVLDVGENICRTARQSINPVRPAFGRFDSKPTVRWATDDTSELSRVGNPSKSGIGTDRNQQERSSEYRQSTTNSGPSRCLARK